MSAVAGPGRIVAAVRLPVTAGVRGGRSGPAAGLGPGDRVSEAGRVRRWPGAAGPLADPASVAAAGVRAGRVRPGAASRSAAAARKLDVRGGDRPAAEAIVSREGGRVR
ncbi:hypothetical protein [Amycolatopsis rubida]|uniref:Uncharacterized protein n=1 Tax=Amycolatopsis rubida TaxID=112413 RepID=A0A1I5S055_9PSEU|nr:hypothetical protein [Amycolatopsis rubida]SFP63656.1 hypothetical protein SAMN05421854_106119 [Amycolatopsis rubida]